MRPLLLLTLLSLTLQAQSSWKNVDNIPKSWGMLERDSIGYVVYNPCNGGTPRITLDSGFVTVYWQLDAPSKLHINKFTLQDGNRSFNIIASNEEENMEFNATTKNESPLLVLWQFGDYKWVMTDNEYKTRTSQNMVHRFSNKLSDKQEPFGLCGGIFFGSFNDRNTG